MPKPRAATNRVPVRSEFVISFPMADGTIRRAIIRSALVYEDPYLKLVRAKLFSLRTRSEFAAELTDRRIKDALIKQNIQV